MLSPREFIKSYSKTGAAKAQDGSLRLFVLAVLAGFFISIAGAATNTAAFAQDSVSAVKLVCALLFPFGLLMVILSGSELFTGNCLMLISLLERTASVRGVLRNLAVVYLGNFAGAFLTAAACAYSGQLDLHGGMLAMHTIEVAVAKCGLSFGKALLLGVLCNVLVCAAVVFASMAGSIPGKAIGAYVPVCFFVLCGFEHSIANMYYVPAGLLAARLPQYDWILSIVDVSGLSWGAFLLKNLLPVTLGNVIGGAGVALLLWLCHGRLAEKHEYSRASRM